MCSGKYLAAILAILDQSYAAAEAVKLPLVPALSICPHLNLGTTYLITTKRASHINLVM